MMVSCTITGCPGYANYWFKDKPYCQHHCIDAKLDDLNERLSRLEKTD